MCPPQECADLILGFALVLAHRAGNPQLGCPRDRLQAFSRRALTARLAAVLAAAIGQKRELLLPDLW